MNDSNAHTSSWYEPIMCSHHVSFGLAARQACLCLQHRNEIIVSPACLGKFMVLLSNRPHTSYRVAHTSYRSNQSALLRESRQGPSVHPVHRPHEQPQVTGATCIGVQVTCLRRCHSHHLDSDNSFSFHNTKVS